MARSRVCLREQPDDFRDGHVGVKGDRLGCDNSLCQLDELLNLLAIAKSR